MRMAMGIRDGEQSPLWVVTADLPKSPGHPFYARLNALLDANDFDRFVEQQCQRFYASVMGRPSLTPGRYFRLLLLGYFEGIDSERGIAWRATDSLAVRSFLGLAVQDAPPDHSTMSRTRRLIDLETHRTVFTWVQQRLVDAGLLHGKTIAIDATTLEANAAMRSIVRRDTGESYQAFLTRLAEASGIKTPTREALARLDRKRKKKTSNKDWTNPFDPDAKVTKMKDGRTHLAHKAEHAVDLETGAIVAVTLQALTKAIPRRSSRPRRPQPRRSKRRRPMSTSRSRWTRSSPTRGITAIRRWSTSMPRASGRMWRSQIGGAATGRRPPRPRRRCMAIVAASVDHAAGA